MKTDLSHLSHAQKDELIHALEAQVQALTGQLLTLQKVVEKLQGQLALNSKNSSKPPSSDGLNKPKPKSLRTAGQRPSGGQKGHQGQTLWQTQKPDFIETHMPAEFCDLCQCSLTAAEVVETRQVFDIPVVAAQVTEHRLLQARCACGKLHRGEFPEQVSASVQYGPVVKAAMVHLTQHHMLPLQRTAELIGDFFGLNVSQATVLKTVDEGAGQLISTVENIKQAVQASPVAGADETGMRVDKKLHWLHVAVTEHLTVLGSHAKRGQEAFDALGILPNFQGTLIHDGWRPYRALNCQHGLCNAHHLRELTYLFEEQQHEWASNMIDLLKYASYQPSAVDSVRLGHMRYAYDCILAEGFMLYPQVEPQGTRRRVKQSKATNLLLRLREYADDVWRFMSDPEVPFSNNWAEQAVRMPKVKQKVSGGFRTANGLESFCIIRSYLATLQKQGANLFDALVKTFQGSPPQPRFS